MPKPVAEDYGIPLHDVVVVTGPRTWEGPKCTGMVRTVLLREMEERGEFTLIHGNAKGLDRMSAVVAEELRIQYISVPYFGWLGPGGGNVRNGFMLTAFGRPRTVHGFHYVDFDDLPQPGSGTANCFQTALNKRLTSCFHNLETMTDFWYRSAQEELI